MIPANDTRFDCSSAVSTPAVTFRRDFVFNVGGYTDDDATGTTPRFVISASKNATRSRSLPKNPRNDPFRVTTAGWYTLTHPAPEQRGHARGGLHHLGRRRLAAPWLDAQRPDGLDRFHCWRQSL